MLTKKQIEKIRQFNRDYTELLGVLNKKIFNTDLSWPEGRILIEIGLNDLLTPMMISKKLKMDKSYVSRIITKLAKKELLVKIPSTKDSRSVEIKLTDKGKEVWKKVNEASNKQVENWLKDFDSNQQEEFFEALEIVNKLLKENGDF